MEEILFNARIFAKFLLQNLKTLDFSLRPIQTKDVFEQDQVRNAILTKTARELRMNKSSHWYQRKRLLENNTIRLYNKSKHHFI
ncbi:MAG: hypothetical protein JRN15_16885, partial [Nitrososphaerota archaeon]|nr:hypothetical protein [Nitrososphaerota archaeon]